MGINQTRKQMPHYGSIENFLKNDESEENPECYRVNPEHPWSYDFKYEYKNGNEKKYWNLDEEKNNINRLLKYRTDDNDYDCDGSLEYGCNLTRDIYRILWDWKAKDDKGDDKHKQPYAKVGDKGWMAGPDTLNSFFSALFFASNVPGKGKISEKLYHEIIDSQRRLNEFLLKEKDETAWEDFSLYYHTLGNFSLVPAGFNTFRARQCGDLWDLSLFYLKQEAENSWLNRDDIFTKYINYFFLWDYVKYDGTHYQVKSLRKHDFANDAGEIINGDEQRWLEVDETSLFLKNTMWAIKRRGIFMTAMLWLESVMNSVEYGELRKTVFWTSEPYSGYDKVIEKIKDTIGISIEEAIEKAIKEEKIKADLKEALADLKK